QQITSIGKDVEKRELSCWWECKLVGPLWKTVWRFLEKLKTELPYDQSDKISRDLNKHMCMTI
ncbi:hypothetical protein PSY84_23970, partial [Shigella flexneri]|nr:hypothetical protein [Shigella flexneri]